MLSNSSKGRIHRNSSFRESLKKTAAEKNSNNGTGGAAVDKSNSAVTRRQSVVQMELNKQKPKLATKLYPTYIDMPQMWAEVSDTQKM